MAVHTKSIVVLLWVTSAPALLNAASASTAMTINLPIIAAQTDRADLALSTNLWHAEFLAQAGGKDPTDLRDGDRARLSSGTSRAFVSSETDNNSVKDAAEELFEDAMQLPLDDIVPQSSALSVSCQTLSEWEMAICNAGDPQNNAVAQQGGPSAVTAIVAIVGAIVVLGAYTRKT